MGELRCAAVSPVFGALQRAGEVMFEGVRGCLEMELMELMAGLRKWTRGGSEESGQTWRNEEVSDKEEGEKPRLANMLPGLERWHIVRWMRFLTSLLMYVFSPSFYSLPFILFSLFLLNWLILMFDFLITLKCCGVGGDYGTCLLWLSIQVMSILLFRDWAFEGRECS